MKLKCFLFLLIACISSTVIFYANKYYSFKDDVNKQDLIVLETIKTLKKLLVFTANDIKENASIEEIQKSLSIHFGYNLILDNDLLLNSSRLFVIKNGKLLSSLGIKSEINNQLNFAEALSKKYGNRTILYSDPLSEDGSIYLLYTAQGSPNTFTFYFPLTVLSNVKIQLLEKTGLNAFKLPPLTETNRFLSEEFVSENEFFHNELNFWKTINKGCLSIFLIFLVQALIFLSYLLLIRIANLKKNRLLTTFLKLLETNTEEETIKKILDHKNIILELKGSSEQLQRINMKLKKIADINQKSVALERDLNKKIAKNLDHDLRKITQLAGDSTKNFNSGISMSNQMIENLLNTIKDSTAKLLFLRHGQPNANAHMAINVRDCFKKALTIFGPQLHDLECKIDITHFNEKLTYHCSETALIQTFNGILHRLLFSMEQADGNFIRVTTKNKNNCFQIVFENSSLGIYPTTTDTTELVSSCLAVPNWISTKAIAQSINVSIEESFILGKGDTLILAFNGGFDLLKRGGSTNENVYSIS